jgi:DNA-binding NarL/FixJ family response regulator/DNA-binding SARP family transcriptional activator
MGDEHGATRFHILGPVGVTTAAGPVAFARRQHRALLAYLVLNATRPVPADQLVDAMWGPRVPATGRAQLKNMLSAVRTALTGLATIDRLPGGYRLRPLDGVLDLARFDDALARARLATTPGDAIAPLRAALDEWRGPTALVGVEAAFADAARAHLEERRIIAVEDLFDAELAAGRHLAIVADLVDAVTTNPVRERLTGQLMTALYRGGRQADALAAYRRTRQLLTDEYGLEPGHALRDLERRVLRADPALGPPEPAAPPPAADIRVLVVDDQLLIRAGLIALLRAAPGIAVVGEADDGEEAVRRAARDRPDVVLMDVRMPGTDGLSATERIVPLGVKVIVLTTFDLDEYVYRALRAGAHGFLLKNTPPDRLLAALTAVTDGEAVYAPSVLRRLVEAYTERPVARPSLDALTAREREVLRLIGRGLSNHDIAGRLVVAEATVKTHVTRLMAKLGLTSRAQAVVMAYESGLVHPAR